jgi:hypothetical protein
VEWGWGKEGGTVQTLFCQEGITHHSSQKERWVKQNFAISLDEQDVILAPEKDNPTLPTWISLCCLTCWDPAGYPIFQFLVLFIAAPNGLDFTMLLHMLGPCGLPDISLFYSLWPPTVFHSATFALPSFHHDIILFNIMCQHFDVDTFPWPRHWTLLSAPLLSYSIH